MQNMHSLKNISNTWENAKCNEYALKHAKYAKYVTKMRYAEYAFPTLLMLKYHRDVRGQPMS
jgi:hypothetical protein